MTQDEWMQKLKGEGYADLQVCQLPTAQELGVHTHGEQTVHVILEGALTLVEQDGSVRTLQPTDRFDIPAGTTHDAKTGPSGCRMIVGVKH